MNSPRRTQPRSIPPSGAPSQGPSKAPSVRGSSAQSRIHSPSGSVQSSPRNINRGRRLPVDEFMGHGSPTTHMTSLEPSRPLPGNSPRVYAETTFAAPVPSISITRDVYNFGAISNQSNNPPTYYVPPPHPQSLHASPNQMHSHFPPSSGEHYHQPYPVHPSNGYANPPPNAPPMQQNYAGTPPYPMYNPYAYPYGQPYVYWNNGPPQSDLPGAPQYPHYAPVQSSPLAPPSRLAEPESDVEGNLPPPTLISRPPPPQASDAVAGYREVALPHDDKQGEVVRERLAGDVVFGSVGLPGGSQIPSPAPTSAEAAKAADNAVSGSKERSERTITAFSIGIGPGEAGPSHVRSRTRSQPRLRTDASSGGSDTQGHQASVVDMTDPETKWAFGTAGKIGGEVQDESSADQAPSASPLRVGGPSVEPQPSDVQYANAAPELTQVPQGVPLDPLPPVEFHPGSQWQQHQVAPLTNGLQLQTGVGPYPLQPISAQLPTGSTDDSLEVKDYGFGFGRRGGANFAQPLSAREERAPVQDWGVGDGARGYGRPRRGSYSAYGERGGYEPRGSFEGRGGYAGRRGRGLNGGYGRGYASRGYARGGATFYNHRGPPPAPPPPPFTVTPPPQAFQPLPHAPTPPQADVGQYYPPLQHQFVPQGYEYQQYPPPMPPPSAPLSAPAQPVPPVSRPMSDVPYLDPTRFFLLGQLEYYLSTQNMATDFFLRQKMDSRGWIPIALLASFNRVQQLTQDAQLVREAVGLSHVLEVLGDFVRMGAGEWQQFVLPDAERSTVEPQQYRDAEDEPQLYRDAEDEEEEEEEEEVEFVMGQVGQPWVATHS
ncbi:hypothetical protein FA95DRAFT_1196417 [Auriscalpium vulgare]|uniref:Uncharacterized protein n=1 Tax=Auriscalpium vulgare TaxID=40419 RepID=A0ACB8RVS8_9AGAM|nr:hypothetical protein FA95DRAFT_1196417 [Auriscalpium vulgare]